MKKLFFVLTLLLTMLFAPFVFAVELVNNSHGFDGVNPSILIGDRPDVIVFDFAGSHRNIVLPYNFILDTQPQSAIFESAGTNATRFNSGQLQEAGNREGIGKSVFFLA